MNLRYKVCHGPIDTHYVPYLKAFDATLFQEHPYLFIPNLEHETWYWNALSTPTTILVLAYDGELLVGAALATSTEEYLGHARVLHQHAAYHAGHSLYIPWIAVTTAYQKRGIGRELVLRCETEARQAGYTQSYLATVMRAKQHPFKPHTSYDPDEIWRKSGYIPAQLYEVWLWPTRVGVPGNETIATVDNMVQFWYKAL